MASQIVKNGLLHAPSMLADRPVPASALYLSEFIGFVEIPSYRSVQFFISVCN